MNEADLLAAVFTKFPHALRENCWLYQKTIRDENGTRYFVNVNHYPAKSISGMPEMWEADVCYNDGCQFFGKPHWIKTGYLKDTSAAEVLKWAEELWDRLNPNCYERNQ